MRPAPAESRPRSKEQAGRDGGCAVVGQGSCRGGGDGTCRAAERVSVSGGPKPEGGAVPALWLSRAAARDCSLLPPTGREAGAYTLPKAGAVRVVNPYYLVSGDRAPARAVHKPRPSCARPRPGLTALRLSRCDSGRWMVGCHLGLRESCH